LVRLNPRLGKGIIVSALSIPSKVGLNIPLRLLKNPAVDVTLNSVGPIQTEIMSDVGTSSIETGSLTVGLANKDFTLRKVVIEKARNDNISCDGVPILVPPLTTAGSALFTQIIERVDLGIRPKRPKHRFISIHEAAVSVSESKKLEIFRCEILEEVPSNVVAQGGLTIPELKPTETLRFVSSGVL
jgi:hypothetical protein